MLISSGLGGQQTLKSNRFILFKLPLREGVNKAVFAHVIHPPDSPPPLPICCEHFKCFGQFTGFTPLYKKILVGLPIRTECTSPFPEHAKLTEHKPLRHKLKSCTVPFLYRSDLVNPGVCCTVPTCVIVPCRTYLVLYRRMPYGTLPTQQKCSPLH